jgi:predicted esterase YcpF (UPF0227 family)
MVQTQQNNSIPDHLHEILDDIVSDFEMLDDGGIGNSLGGFWANIFRFATEFRHCSLNQLSP